MATSHVPIATTNAPPQKGEINYTMKRPSTVSILAAFTAKTALSSCVNYSAVQQKELHGEKAEGTSKASGLTRDSGIVAGARRLD